MLAILSLLARLALQLALDSSIQGIQVQIITRNPRNPRGPPINQFNALGPVRVPVPVRCFLSVVVV